jgi:hypothetical protein
MAFGLFALIKAGSYATKAAGILKSHGDAKARDEGNINSAKATAKRNNDLASRNFQIINEEQLAEMVANGQDKFDIAKEIRANKANALAARGGDGSLSSNSLKTSLQDIARDGLEVIARKDMNFGAKLRNLGIKRENITINTQGLNAQAFNQISLSASDTGTGLKLAGVGLQAFEDLGFKKSSSSGKVIPKWETN